MEEEPHSLPDNQPTLDYSSTVDTSSPFRSVKEAVAIFGERLLTGEIYSPKPYNANYVPKQETAWKYFSPSPTPKPKAEDNENVLFDTLKRLEAELEETKVELKLLKERESETEVALASLNAELHKNMSKQAQAEAAAAATRAAGVERANSGIREEERRSEMMIRMEDSPTLAQILRLGGEGYFGGKQERKTMKKKPIIPLVGDLFSRKKRSSSALNNHLYSSPHLYH